MSQSNDQVLHNIDQQATVATVLLKYIGQEFLDADARQALSAEDDLLSAGIIDSLGVMRLIAFMESEFSINVPPEDVTIEHFINVQTMSVYVLRQKSNRS